MPRRSEFYYSEARNQYRKRIQEPDGTTHDVWADSKPELRAKLKEIEKVTELGGVYNDTTTLIEYAMAWFPTAVAGLSYSAKNDYLIPINKHIAPYFGNMKLKDIKPLHIDKFLLSKEGLSKSSMQKILLTLRSILNSAVENGLIQRNPCLNKKSGGVPTASKKPITTEQQKKLLDAVCGTRVYIFIVIALYAGLRREEILGLSWTDVHINIPAPYLEVTQAVHFEKTKAVKNSLLKSKSAYRKIPIPPQLVEALEVEKARQKKNNIIGIDNLVVPDTQGMVCSQTAFNNLWALVKRRTIKPAPAIIEPETATPKPDKHPYCKPTLDFTVTAHQLRHTYITRLCASGMDIKKIQYLAGHSTVQMTLNIYSHVVDNRPDQLYDTIANVFG